MLSTTITSAGQDKKIARKEDLARLWAENSVRPNKEKRKKKLTTNSSQKNNGVFISCAFYVH